MCISCQQLVRPRQEGLQCDGCLRWQHRTFNTGVSQSEYRDAVKTGASIDWRCVTCDVPQAESTALSEISASAYPDADFDSEQTSDQGNFIRHILLIKVKSDQTLPGVQLNGCSFHWTQALWRKVRSQPVK